MKLQYLLSNGNWADCGDSRTNEFLDKCVKFGGVGDRDAVIAALAAGKKVSNGPNEWHANCRDAEAAVVIRERKRAAAFTNDARPVLHCNSCGQTGYAGGSPFSTLPESGLCDDCVC